MIKHWHYGNYIFFSRQVLAIVKSQTKHRHQRHILVISVSVLFLFIVTLKHVKLRNSAQDIVDELEAGVKRAADTFQEFDYDVELTEEERQILSRSFRSADFDNNKLLTETEMSMAINRETKQHIVVSKMELRLGI